MSATPDRTLVVTGGNRGIGAAVAKLAGARGYQVAIGYKTAGEKASAVLSEIERAGGRAISFRVDVANPGEVEHFFEAVDRTFGVPSALVNSAGATGGVRSFLDLAPQELQAIVAANLFGTAYCMQAAARRMARSRGGRGGAIVNISSEAARFGGKSISAYAAAKAGVNTLTAAVARELADDGIRVNAISPGVIKTDQFAGLDEQRIAGLIASIPLRRMGDPEEVARTILFLLSDEASYITGSVVSVHGGR